MAKNPQAVKSDDDKPAPTAHTLTNLTRGDIVIYDATGKAVTIPREGGEVKASLRATTLERLQTQFKGRIGVDETSKEKGERRQLGQQQPKEEADTAQKVLDDYADGKIEYTEFTARAKKIVGDEKWPNGTPNKSVVISLLKAEIK